MGDPVRTELSLYRFFIQESNTPTKFTVLENVQQNTALGKNPGCIVGSVALVGWYQIAQDDITPELARATCISEAGLASALEMGYKFCWRWSAPARFDRPIPVREMNISPSDCELWSKCHESPRTRLPPAGYLLARMQEILSST